MAAVKIAAHHLNKRGGVLIGDVVGLGKTLMATALAQDLRGRSLTETLIICPKNLVQDVGGLRRRVSPARQGAVDHAESSRELPDLRRYRSC